MLVRVNGSASNQNRLSRWLLLAVCALCLLLGAARAANTPYWFDEISTVRLAAMPTWAATFRGTQTLDLSPPLLPFLVRASAAVLGPNELAGRVPSILAFTLATACLFAFLRRRMSPWFAAFAAFLWMANSEVFFYATEARPYALLLAMFGLALVGYDDISQARKTARGRILLFVGVAGMLLTHVFAVFAWGALALAEVLRTLRRKQIDWPIWIVLALPLGICMLYRPLMQTHGVMLYPPMMRATVAAGLRVYIYFFLMPVARVLGAALIVLLFMKTYPGIRFAAWCRLQREEWALLLVTLAMPVIVALLMIVTNPTGGYFARYGVVMLFPATILLVAWIAWRSRGSVAVAKTLVTFALFAILFAHRDLPKQLLHTTRRGWLGPPVDVASTGGVDKVLPELPLVANDGLEFMEADYRLHDADLKRFYYLLDTPAALRLSHANSLETMPVLLEPFHVRGHVVPMHEFLQQHEDFLVIGEVDRSTSWLMKWAMEQGADIRFMGNYTYAGSTMPLWHVMLRR